MVLTELRFWTVGAIAVLATAFEAVAAESVVYNFPGGSVTITPRDPATGVPKPGSYGVEQAVPRIQPRNASAITAPKDSTRLHVRPASFQQDDAPAQPASPAVQQEPAPGEIVPARAVVEDTPAPQTAERIPALQAVAEVAAPSEVPTNSAPAVVATPAGSTPAAPTPNPEGTVLPALRPRPYDQPERTMELPVITPHVSDATPEMKVVPSQTLQYRDVYFSIPFNRVEYNANPSYRHDATMEFLFNQMRPTVIQRGTSNVYHYDMNNGYGGGSAGYPYWPYYPFNYGLRIHSSR